MAGARARPPRHATSLPACLPPLLASVSLDDATPPPCSLSLSPGSPSLSLSPGRTPPPSSSWRQSARRVAGARARPERHATSSSACLPRQRDAAALLLGAAPIPWPYPPLSPVLLPPSLSRPNTTVAAVRHSRRLRPPLAPPTSSGAPPRLPLPPHRSTGLRKPCIAATSPFPSSGSDRRRRRIRRLQRVPEPASTPTATAVSSATVSLSSPPRSRVVTPFPTMAEPPPSPSSPSTQLR